MMASRGDFNLNIPSQPWSEIVFFTFPKFNSDRGEGFSRNIFSQMYRDVARYRTQNPWNLSQMSYAETQHNPDFSHVGYNPTNNPSLHSQFI
jgi:hypothetical protein